MTKVEEEAAEELRRLVRAFLETEPLYKKQVVAATVPLPSGIEIFPSTLGRFCPGCEARTTWHAEWPGAGSLRTFYAPGYLADYRCSECPGGERRQERLSIWVTVRAVDLKVPQLSVPGLFDSTASQWELRKIGQSELPVPRVDRSVERVLGDEAPYYRKALGCYAGGFGLGAHAYLRRIIENRTSDILDRIEEAARIDGDEETRAKLELARKGTRESDRLRLAANALPSWLRPGGTNPLAILYGAYSDELHNSESEETALERARTLMKAFEFLVVRVAEHFADFKEFGQTLQSENSPPRGPEE